MNNHTSHYIATKKWDFRNAPIVWGICLGGYLTLTAYWLSTAPLMGTPLSRVGDWIALLAVILLIASLFAGIFSLLLWGVGSLIKRIEQRPGKFDRLGSSLAAARRAPWTLLWGLLGVFSVLMFAPGNSSLWIFPLAVAVVGGALIGFSSSNHSWMRYVSITLAVLIVVVSAYVFFLYGQDDYLATEPGGAEVSVLQTDDPGLPGNFSYEYLTYGSGTDRHRAEYGKDVSIMTSPVDASLLWGGFDGYFKTYYRQYWGFSVNELPLNGRVWLPEGSGPFPLILFVHGNHPWNDFSDPGYAYLGEHLASHGYIAVSVDENFLNGFSFGDPGGVEIPARGWVMLKHIELFKNWNDDPQSLFHNKVDMNNIALMGHSNGGEAVAVAAYFNDLDHLPGNTAVRFNFHFPIQAVIQLAPSDSVYRPAGKLIELKDLDYLLLQGAHDSQVVSVSGLGQYNRTSFSPESDNFKTAIYFYRGNHVHFNTAWDPYDYAGISGLLLNQKPVMEAEHQRQFAKATMTAFLDASLRNNAEYRAWFRDLRRGMGWLPQDIYINAYQDASYKVVEDFQSVRSTAQTECLGGMKCNQMNVQLRSYNKPQNNTAILLNWMDDSEQEAAYALTIPPDMSVTAQDVFVFSLATIRSPANLRVELLDEDGDSVHFDIDQIGPLHPALVTRLYRFPQLAQRLGYEEPQGSETMFQAYEIPLDELQAVNPDFEPDAMTQVIFHADAAQAGMVWLDEIGFRTVP